MKIEKVRSQQVRHAIPIFAGQTKRGTKPGQTLPVGAPSVLSPEIAIPSAGACGTTLQSPVARRSFCLRDYRGGCSFGPGAHPRFSRRANNQVASLAVSGKRNSDLAAMMQKTQLTRLARKRIARRRFLMDSLIHYAHRHHPGQCREDDAACGLAD